MPSQVLKSAAMAWQHCPAGFVSSIGSRLRWREQFWVHLYSCHLRLAKYFFCTWTSSICES